MEINKTRPKYLNLLKIRMPVTAVVSIAHRLSGVLLVISLPVVIYIFQRSLHSAPAYDAVMQMLSQPVAKLFFIVGAWAIGHHFFAGIRFLLIDIDVGVIKSSARRSAWLVHLLALLSAVVVAIVLL